MTAETERSIRAVTRLCRGLRMAYMSDVVLAMYDAGPGRADMAAWVISLSGPDADPEDVLAALIDAGKMGEAQKFDMLSRRPCGHDVNDMILSHPLDGKPKVGVCPSCGSIIHWAPPRVREEPEVEA